ncbi:MAG: hypothetical protein RAO92_08365 [Candidatus Euphemobacter frigidus]|nr:hypothetical protein [Candidatus Euphemobacter frigidus]MDP8276401.1 hypothetical protein [Candidatus Euphemobacter frigidus]
MNQTISAMDKNPKFHRFLEPLDESRDFLDATYFLRNDGTMVFSEGYYHEIEKPREERRVLSHIVFVPWDYDHPSPDYSRKDVFGQLYENITKEIMNNQPLDRFYPLQLEKYKETDPSQREIERPVYARYKSLVPVTELIGCFPTRHSLKAIIEKAGEEEEANNIRIVTEHTAELLGIDVDRIGISGSLSLGTYGNPHDVDFVIYGSAEEVRRMVGFMQHLTDTNEKRKVYEFGKYWPIRFWEWAEGKKFMICPFFSYLDPEEAPLRNFDCKDRGEAKITARITDDTHNAFNPTILMVEDVRLNGREYPDLTRLILYHGGERGDWREGYRIRARGNHVRIRTYRMEGGERQPEEEFEALLINNLNQVKKL